MINNLVPELIMLLDFFPNAGGAVVVCSLQEILSSCLALLYFSVVELDWDDCEFMNDRINIFVASVGLNDFKNLVRYLLCRVELFW